MGDVKICNNKITKLNDYFYMNGEGDILKYKNFVLYIRVKNKLHSIMKMKKYFYIVMIIN